LPNWTGYSGEVHRIIGTDGMRDNSEGYLELRNAYERDGLYFGVVGVRTPSETASFKFGVERTGYLAQRRIFESPPFGSMPGVKHNYYFNGSHSQEKLAHEPVDIGIRIEEGKNGTNLYFPCPLSLAKNLKWFLYLNDLQEAAALRRVQE
jgi:hypothetical protein